MMDLLSAISWPFAAVLVVNIVIFVLALSKLLGPSTGKAKTRRLTAVRDRHVATTEGVVAAQMRRTIASRAGGGAGAGIGGLLPRQDMLKIRLRRTGKSWTLSQFAFAVMGTFIGVLALTLLVGMPFLLSLLIALALGIGIPHFAVSFLINKRVKQFDKRFADAIDLLVRGLRSGLPVTETFHLISTEMPGPVGEEFRLITERMRIGKSVDAALAETATTIGTAEFKFFCITITIQRETGGNLAETLGNLSDVLRKRAQMVLKVRALSSEAKASAYIVGALPFVVFGAVYSIEPDYLGAFFTDQRLMMIGGGAFVWMGLGALMMAKMVRFEI